jgi:hypothetical protein
VRTRPGTCALPSANAGAACKQGSRLQLCLPAVARPGKAAGKTAQGGAVVGPVQQQQLLLQRAASQPTDTESKPDLRGGSLSLLRLRAAGRGAAVGSGCRQTRRVRRGGCGDPRQGCAGHAVPRPRRGAVQPLDSCIQQPAANGLIPSQVLLPTPWGVPHLRRLSLSLSPPLSLSLSLSLLRDLRRSLSRSRSLSLRSGAVAVRCGPSVRGIGPSGAHTKRSGASAGVRRRGARRSGGSLADAPERGRECTRSPKRGRGDDGSAGPPRGRCCSAACAGTAAQRLQRGAQSKLPPVGAPAVAGGLMAVTWIGRGGRGSATWTGPSPSLRCLVTAGPEGCVGLAGEESLAVAG